MSSSPFFDYGVISTFDALRTQLDRLLRNPNAPATLRSPSQLEFPPVNVGTCANSIEVMVFVPGVDPKALKVSIEKGLLTITGHRQAPERPDEVIFYAKERAMGSFTRLVELPSDIDPDHIEAKYREGCLRISIKKKESSKPRLVTIQ